MISVTVLPTLIDLKVSLLDGHACPRDCQHLVGDYISLILTPIFLSIRYKADILQSILTLELLA